MKKFQNKILLNIVWRLLLISSFIKLIYRFFFYFLAICQFYLFIYFLCYLICIIKKQKEKYHKQTNLNLGSEWDFQTESLNSIIIAINN